MNFSKKWFLDKQVQCINGPPVLKLTSQTNQVKQIKNTKFCKLIDLKVFGTITKNSIFFVASMAVKTPPGTSYSFQVFLSLKHLTIWLAESMPASANPK